MRNAYGLMFLPILLLFVLSCQKHIAEKDTPDDNGSIYKTWLNQHGGSYQNGRMIIQNPDGEILQGELNWSKLTEYVWEGKTFVDIPFEFNGNDKINNGEILPGTSFTLVLKMKEGNVLDGAIRTTSHNVSLINEQGKSILSTIDSYQKLNGEYLNMWQKVNNAHNKLYRKKSSSGLSKQKILSAKELKAKRDELSRNIDRSKIAPVCFTDTYISYENYCYYANYQDEVNMNATCTLLPHVNEVTTCNNDNSGGGDGGDFPPGGGGSGGSGPQGPETIEEAIEYNPFALFTYIPCEILKQWINTAKHQAPQSSTNKLNAILGNYHASPGIGAPGFVSTASIQNLASASSSSVNLDYFPITINELPIINGQRLTAEQFMAHIRLNINNMVDTAYAKFTPYNAYGVNDHALWASNDPLNTIISIDISGPDNGSVIVTKYNSTGSWTFTTIFEPYFGSHPVSGNRDFGYVQNTNGSYTFFTRGVDRLTSWDATFVNIMANHFNNDYPFTESDKLWKSFQNKISQFVNQNGGTASVAPPQVYRPQWKTVQKIMQGILPLSVLGQNCPD